MLVHKPHNGYDTYFAEFIVQFPFFWRSYFEDLTKIEGIGAKRMEASVEVRLGRDFATDWPAV